jgi:hypothetical protein
VRERTLDVGRGSTPSPPHAQVTRSSQGLDVVATLRGEYLVMACESCSGSRLPPGSTAKEGAGTESTPHDLPEKPPTLRGQPRYRRTPGPASTRARRHRQPRVCRRVAPEGPVQPLAARRAKRTVYVARPACRVRPVLLSERLPGSCDIGGFERAVGRSRARPCRGHALPMPSTSPGTRPAGAAWAGSARRGVVAATRALARLDPANAGAIPSRRTRPGARICSLSQLRRSRIRA